MVSRIGNSSLYIKVLSENLAGRIKEKFAKRNTSGNPCSNLKLLLSTYIPNATINNDNVKM
jgi:hypothetical protein